MGRSTRKTQTNSRSSRSAHDIVFSVTLRPSSFRSNQMALLTSLHFMCMIALQAIWLYISIFYGVYLALRYPRDPNFGHRLGPLYAPPAI